MERVFLYGFGLYFLGLAALFAEPDSTKSSETTAPTPNPESFTLAILPDTQYYHIDNNLYHFFAQTKWIAENAEKFNIAYVIHLGDITQDNLPEQWENSRRAYDVLDEANIPYSMAFGNHDYTLQDGGQGEPISLGNEYFETKEFEKWPTCGGVMEEGQADNNYHLFEAKGTKFLILNLQYDPPDHVIAWADAILSQYPDRKAIVVTHAYLYYDNSRYDKHGGAGKQSGAPSINDGEMLWQKLLKKHANVYLVLSGHVTGDGQGRLLSKGDHGNDVHQILCNFQMLPEGGGGFLRLMEVSPEEGTIKNITYSPSLDEYKTDPQNQFTLGSDEDEILYDSHFDSLQAGPLVGQDLWILQSGSASQAEIVEAPDTAFTDSQCLQLTGVPGSDVFVRKTMAANTLSDNQNNHLSFAFRTNAVDANTSLLNFSAGGNFGGQKMAEIQVDIPGDRIFVSTHGKSYDTIVQPSDSLRADTWYKLDILLAPSAKNYRLTLTDTTDSSILFDSTFAFKDTEPVYKQFYSIMFGNSTAGGNDWLVDDIIIRSSPRP